MRAVASVVMNRVRIDYGEYGRYNTLRDVIFAGRGSLIAPAPSWAGRSTCKTSTT